MFRSIVETILIEEEEENKSGIRFVERRENRHHKRNKEKHGLLVALDEQTDVIHLYGRGMTVLHAPSRSLIIMFYMFDDNVTSIKREKQLKEMI